MIEHQLDPIEIRPEVTMLSVLRHLNYKAWFAIAEFIDNAIQSYVANEARLRSIYGFDYQLKIDVELDTTPPGRIIITDNAAGISAKDFARAFRPAQVPIDRNGLSEFGMGMKSAACWFAEKWSVRTKSLDEVVERTIYFDVENIVENKIESLTTETRQVDPSTHYTVVSLRGLHHLPQGRTIGKIKAHLASIYRVFLRDGRLKLRFNDEELAYLSPKILFSPPYIAPGQIPLEASVKSVEWKKNVDLDFGDGQRVRGFAALREVGSTPLAGFALFRRDRLIIGSHDETYRPSYIFKQTNSYPYQRLFGELHVEGFEVSHTKDGFRWEEYEDIFLEYLKNAIESQPLNLISQAENYRALPIKRNIAARANFATDAVAAYIENEVAPILISAKENPTTSPPIFPETSTSSQQTSERTVTVDDGDYQWIITLSTSIDPSRDEWVSLSKLEQTGGDGGRKRRLGIDLSLAHPFSTEFIGANNENVELLLRISTAICISLILSEDITGENPEGFFYHFNNLLRGAIRNAIFDNENISDDTGQN